jgi:hypothetical protein
MADFKAPAFDPQKFAKWWMCSARERRSLSSPWPRCRSPRRRSFRRGLLLWNQRWNQTGGPEWKNPCVATDYCRVRSLPPQPVDTTWKSFFVLGCYSERLPAPSRYPTGGNQTAKTCNEEARGSSEAAFGASSEEMERLLSPTNISRPSH